MYDAFISYSHAADGQLAPQLQAGLQAFAKPWWRRRVLRIFRDQTGLSANPHLWASIEEALAASRYLVILASPQAAGSEWVGKELDWWLTHRGVDSLLGVGTEGIWSWDPEAQRLRAGPDSAVHPRLAGAFAAEPRHIDLTWAHTAQHVDAHDARFRDAIADLAAPLHGKAKDELYGEDVRQHRRTLRLAWGAAASLAILATAAIIAGSVAVRQRAAAEFQAGVATARGIAAFAVAQTPIRIDRALLLGAEAALRHPAPETGYGLLTALNGAAGLQRFVSEPGSDTVSAIVSNDRREVLTLSASGELQRWAMPDWRLLRKGKVVLDGAVFAFYRQDDRLIAVTGNGGMVVFDRETLRPLTAALAVPENPDSISLPDLSMDGRSYAWAQYLGDRVNVGRIAGGPVVTFTPTDCEGIIGVFWLRDNRRIAVSCNAGTQIYDAFAARFLGRDPARMQSAGAYPNNDDRLLALIPMSNEMSVLRMPELKPAMPAIKVPGGRVYSTAYDLSGRFLAIGTDIGAVVVWDLVNQREIARLANMELGAMGVDWLDDRIDYQPGKGISGSGRLLVMHEERLSEWSLTRPLLLGDMSQPERIGVVSPMDRPIDTSRNRALRLDEDGQLRAVDLATGRTESLATLPAGRIESLTVAADGSRAFWLHSTEGPRVLEFGPEGQRRALAVPENLRLSLIKRFAAARTADEPSKYTVRFSTDNRRIALVGDGVGVIWSLEDGAVVAATAHDPMIRNIAWSPDGTRIASSRYEGLISLWDAGDWRKLGEVKYLASYTVKDLYASAALDGIVVTSEGGEVGVLDPNKAVMKPLVYRSGGSQLQSSAVSPDGRTLAAWSSDGAVRIWDVATGAAIAPPLRGHPSGRSPNRIWFDADNQLWSYTPGMLINWKVGIEESARLACRIAARSLTEIEWQQFVGPVAFAPSCLGPSGSEPGAGPASKDAKSGN
jgi:WD40 repeat protein